MNKSIRIVSSHQDLKEGLFGQVFLFVFEVLPYLDEAGIMPGWAIRSKLYGTPERDFVVIPGLLDLNYNPEIPESGFSDVSLKELRKRGTAALGNDWDYISKLWAKYFRIPGRIIERANIFPKLDGALGLHYRGTDKNKSTAETNFVSEVDFMELVGDFVGSHPDIRVILIASDESSFVERVRAAYPNLEVLSSGEVVHHKDTAHHDNFAKGDHAVLDCVLLSRCKYLLKCQSALSGFAKVLNPEIEAYRVSANKLARWNREIPYFPDGYLPKYKGHSPASKEILERLFAGDWTENEVVSKKFGNLFRYENRDCRSERQRVPREIAGRVFGCFRRALGQCGKQLKRMGPK